ncbi:hypothetical protein FRB96_003335 [Tulasnella sp. 330]|nr:hypothetical protein FRB96_003335 [Tulasnella sp. 330]
MVKQVSLSSEWSTNTTSFKQDGKPHAYRSSPEIIGDTQLVPLYATALSVIFLMSLSMLQGRQKGHPSRQLRIFEPGQETLDSTVDATSDTAWYRQRMRGVMKAHGSRLAYLYNILRSTICLALLVVSIYALHIQSDDGQPFENVRITQVVLYLYTSLLGLFTILGHPASVSVVSIHLSVLLLVTFGVTFYRNIVPLAMISKVPQDAADGWITWLRVFLLSVAGLVIPAITPRKYNPVDPLNPADPAPEQTASLLSLTIFTYVDPIVTKGYRQPHVRANELPEIPDYERMGIQAERAFPHLDPLVKVGGRHHIFLDLIWLYREQYLALAVFLILKGFAELIGPMALNHLLQYLESGGEGTTFHPWVWVLALGFGPFLSSVLFEQRTTRISRMVVRMEGLITELIFERALKMRFTDDSQKSAPVDAGVGLTPIPNAELVVERSGRPGATDSRNVTLASNSEVADIDNKRKRIDRSPTSSGSGSSRKLKATPIRDDSPKKQKESKNLVGKLTNMVSTDLGNFANAPNFVLWVVDIPFQLGLATWLLYGLLGWSALVGLAVMILIIPIPSRLAGFLHGLQVTKMKKTDARVQTVTETISITRMIKLFGWEERVEKQIQDKRDDELKYIKQRQLWGVAIYIINRSLPLLVSLSTFATFTLIMQQDLTASRIFSSIVIFNLISQQLSMVFNAIPQILGAKVSIDRIDDFLNETDLLDRFAGPEIASVLPATKDADRIGFRNASFVWQTDSGSTGPSGATTPFGRNFQLQVDGDVFFKRGKLNLILGPTGSVLHQCALETDLKLFDAGDATEVGEKGLTLSGGQKARLALARALYSPASILLLDDILSALDVHTSRWIVDKCLGGDLIEGRTILLVTHNIGMVASLTEFVVTLGSNGRVTSQDSIPETLSRDLELREAAQESLDVEKRQGQVIDDKAPAKEKKSSGQLIANEETAEGRIVWSALTFFFSGFGGPLFWITFFACVVLHEASTNFQTWFLGYWARQYETHPRSEVNALLYLSGYSLIILVALLSGAVAFVVYLFATLRAIRRIHILLTRAVLNAPLRWLDSTPSGRITSRFTQDINAIDSTLPDVFNTLVGMTASLLLKLAAVLLYSPIFLFPGIAVGLGGVWIGSIYMKAQLPVKREMSNSRSPVYSHFNTTIAGLTSIRAYGAEEAFKSESRKRIDEYTRPARAFLDLNRWVCIRVNALAGIFASALAAYLVYWRDIGASNAGFSLSMALGFTGMLLFWIRMLNRFEVEGNALERIKAYVDIDQEPQSIDSRKPSAHWPSSGFIRVEGLSAKYSLDGPEVLHDLSFEIRSGERVGVVGRTGAGKSSLVLAFLRMIPTTGKVFYDDVDISEINLDALRNNITSIPQQPELMSGSLRQNLDPFGEHDDATLNGCLRSSGLFELQQEDDENKISLDTDISSGGANLSVGQRQIIALARAMVRRSKVYILDEATASVDYKTDIAIQEAILKEFNDATLIIIAHRLQTIMSANKILVLDGGNVVEFDSPVALLSKEGAFKAMVDGSSDREALYELIKGRRGRGSIVQGESEAGQ